MLPNQSLKVQHLGSCNTYMYRHITAMVHVPSHYCNGTRAVTLLQRYMCRHITAAGKRAVTLLQQVHVPSHYCNDTHAVTLL